MRKRFLESKTELLKSKSCSLFKACSANVKHGKSNKHEIEPIYQIIFSQALPLFKKSW